MQWIVICTNPSNIPIPFGIFFQNFTDINNATMNVQFVTDNNGRKRAVQLPLKQWNKLQKNLKKLELFEDLKQAFKEMEQHRKGLLDTPTTEQLLSQL